MGSELKHLQLGLLEDVEGVTLVLWPMAFPPAKVYQMALFDAGMPAPAFTRKDIAAELDRLRRLGVKFRAETTKAGPITAALFEDTCGNLIYLVRPARRLPEDSGRIPLLETRPDLFSAPADLTAAPGAVRLRYGTRVSVILNGISQAP